MARRNIHEYRDVISHLYENGKVAPDGIVTVRDIIEAFVFTTDKCKPDTIMRHVNFMCGIRILQKKGEISYQIADDWKNTLGKFK